MLAILLCLPSFPAIAQADRGLTIDETLKELGAGISWDPFFASGVLNKGENRLKFYSGQSGEQGLALFDGCEVLNVPLPYLENGALRFPAAFVSAAKASFSPAAAPPAAQPPGGQGYFRIAAIIIDPGHGGKDPGAVRNTAPKLQEKDIALNVSKKLSALLVSAYPGKKILLTRAGDSFPSLEDRVNIANTVPLRENEAIIYISVHVNASLNKSARGYEVWYLPPETKRDLVSTGKQGENAEIAHILNDMLQAEYISESTRMGRFILDHLHQNLGNRTPSRGLKAENWYVVKNARMPAILVELGFISNDEDARLMADEAYLKLYSEALYKGITDFVAEFEQSGGYIAP